jgi:hypothetical protein
MLLRNERRLARVVRCLRSIPDINPDKVVEVAARGRRPPADLTPQEKAAVLAGWCAELGFNRTLDRLPVLSLAELRPEVATEFFIALEEALGDLRRAGMDKTSDDLNRVGQIVAGSLQQWDVEARLGRQADRRAAARLADLPFLPQRGR